MTDHLPDVNQLPSKERNRPERDRYPLDMAGDLQFHRALCSWQYDEIERLRTALTGIQSCSTCEVCRGAAARALGEQPTTGQCQPIFDRAGRCGTCTACGKNFECGALPPGDG